MASHARSSAPILWMVAGPNGSGKSSLYSDIGTEAFDRSVWIINPDLLTERIRLGEGLTLGEANVAAVVRVEAWLEASIKAYQTIGVETVLATDKYRRLVSMAKQQHFEFRLTYIILQSPDLNVERVRLRVRKGGHDVDEAKIRERWVKSLAQLPWFLSQADWAAIYDNSSERPRRIALKRDGTIYLDPAASEAIRAAVELAGRSPS
jgi:predicted ABC-type ATPase